MKRDDQRPLSTLLYGLDKLNYPKVSDWVEKDKGWTLENGNYEDGPKFHEYDGVVLFNGIFERIHERSGYTRGGIIISYDQVQLNVRTNQALKLIEAGGFLCVLLVAPMYDADEYGPKEHTDLGKRFLNRRGFYRHRLAELTPGVRTVRDEFRSFLSEHGAVWNYWDKPFEPKFTLRPICYLNSRLLCGFLLDDHTFALPVVLPKNPDQLADFFHALMDALCTAWKIFSVALPRWAESYVLPEEAKILAEKEEVQQKLVQIAGRLSTFEDFKQCLCSESEILVEHVNNLFRVGFGFQTDSKDEFKQDLTILKEDKPVVVAEIKGRNTNVQREHVNQADSHREENGLPAEFPALLVMNTFLKASSLEEKDRPVPQDQIKHAVNMNVLIVRTLDLLNLLGLVQRGLVSQDRVLEIFQTEKGWLHVIEENYTVET